MAISYNKLRKLLWEVVYESIPVYPWTYFVFSLFVLIC